MAYRFEQTIHGHVYIYEIESFWDAEKKQPRQRRKYLGKKDPQTGEIRSPFRGLTPRAARDFGHLYCVSHIAERVGLQKLLRKVWPETAEALLILAIYQVLEAKPLYLARAWAEGADVDPSLDLSSQRISRLMEELGREEDRRQQFFQSWMKRQRDLRGIFFDITSLSSYSKLIEELEWGYNRDRDNLPQVNLGIIVGQSSELPLAYRVYPGSIADVSTLKNILRLMTEWEVKKVTVVLDRGFYSAANLREMAQDHLHFIIPLSFTTKIASSLLAGHLRDLQSPLSAFYFKGRPMFYVRKKVTIGETEVEAHLFHDERRKADEMDQLMRRLVEIEAQVEEKEFWSEAQVEEHLESVFRGSRSLYEIEGQKPHFRLRRRPKAISRLMNRMGKTILLTNDPTVGREDILLYYRRKDVVEKMFDVIKNELENGKLRVSSREAMEGRLFLTYLSLIIHSALSRIMRDQDLFKTYTLAEVLAELKKLRLVTLTSGRTYLTEISKRQRKLFEKFDVPIPAA
jgi:transposase